MWDKVHASTGYWRRNEHEVLRIGARAGEQSGSVIRSPSTRHSKKPAAAAEIIERYFPTTPKLEMFARHGRPGWDVWGNEIVTEGPKRIQLRRTSGWRLPEGAISVTRPGRWGNPFRVGDDRAALVARHRSWLLDPNRTEGPTLAEIRRETPRPGSSVLVPA
jgi:MT-A70/Domain of unknown function (DUF4326)